MAATVTLPKFERDHRVSKLPKDWRNTDQVLIISQSRRAAAGNTVSRITAVPQDEGDPRLIVDNEFGTVVAEFDGDPTTDFNKALKVARDMSDYCPETKAAKQRRAAEKAEVASKAEAKEENGHVENSDLTEALEASLAKVAQDEAAEQSDQD